MVFQAQGVAQKYNCQLTRLDFQQEKALAASLPLGVKMCIRDRAGAEQRYSICDGARYLQRQSEAGKVQC